MELGEISKQMLMYFVISLVITLMVSFVLSTVKIDNFAYLGVFFGLFVFAYYGVNSIYDDNLIESKYQKIILVILAIAIFYLFFTCLMPYIFDMSAFGIVKIGDDLLLDSNMIFSIFAVIVLIFSLR